MLTHSPLKDRKRALLASTTDQRTYTALHVAVEAGRADIARLLIKHVRFRPCWQLALGCCRCQQTPCSHKDASGLFFVALP